MTNNLVYVRSPNLLSHSTPYGNTSIFTVKLNTAGKLYEKSIIRSFISYKGSSGTNCGFQGGRNEGTRREYCEDAKFY